MLDGDVGITGRQRAVAVEKIPTAVHDLAVIVSSSFCLSPGALS